MKVKDFQNKKGEGEEMAIEVKTFWRKASCIYKS